MKVAAAITFVALWIVGTVLTTVMTARALRSEKSAAVEAELAANVARFYFSKVLDFEHHNDPALRQAVLRAAGHIDSDFRSDPMIQARLHSLAGTLLARSGDPENALVQAQYALESLQGATDPDPNERLGPLSTMADASLQLGRPKEAAQYFGEIALIHDAAKSRRILYQSEWARIRQGLALIEAKDFGRGVHLVEAARQSLIAQTSATNSASLIAGYALAHAYRGAGRTTDSISLLLRTNEAYHDGRHPVFDSGYKAGQRDLVRNYMDIDDLEQGHAVLLALCRSLARFRNQITHAERREMEELLDALILRLRATNRGDLALMLESERSGLNP